MVSKVEGLVGGGIGGERRREKEERGERKRGNLRAGLDKKGWKRNGELQTVMSYVVDHLFTLLYS